MPTTLDKAQDSGPDSSSGKDVLPAHISSGVPASVTVIVPFFKRQFDIEVLLNSFEKLDITGINIEFLVVEDGSEVCNKDELIQRHARIHLRFITNAINRGPAYSRNLAVRESSGTYLWFLDSDTKLVGSDTLKAMIAALNEDSARMVVGGALELVNQELKVMIPTLLLDFKFVYRITTWVDDYAEELPFLTTCNFFLTRKNFISTGGFDAALNMFEDNELSFRLKEIVGGKFYQNARTLVHHVVSSQGREGGKFDYFGDRIKYLRVSLRTRNILLWRYRQWLLAVLPFADSLGATVIVHGLMTGRWQISRITRALTTRGRFHEIVAVLVIAAEFQIKAFVQFFFVRRDEIAVREPSLGPMEDICDNNVPKAAPVVRDLV